MHPGAPAARAYVAGIGVEDPNMSTVTLTAKNARRGRPRLEGQRRIEDLQRVVADVIPGLGRIAPVEITKPMFARSSTHSAPGCTPCM